MKKRFSEEPIIGFLREADAGLPVKELCRQHGFSEASYYLWRSKFGGMTVSDAKRLKEVEAENTRLKKLLAESMREIEVTREALRKKRNNGKAFCGKAMLTRAHRRGVRLFLIEPGKPNQNAYIDRSMVVSVTNASMRTGSRASLMHVF